MIENNNKRLIDDLKLAIEFFESKPEFPPLGPQTLSVFPQTKEKFLECAKHLKSFTKDPADYYFYLVRRLTESIKISVAIERTLICEKVSYWKCPDESLIDAYNTLSEETVMKAEHE